MAHPKAEEEYGFGAPQATIHRVVNAVVSAARRPVSWVSFTVPQARVDQDYFAPLRDLEAGPETELYFALVPYYPADQPHGTTAEQVSAMIGLRSRLKSTLAASAIVQKLTENTLANHQTL